MSLRLPQNDVPHLFFRCGGGACSVVPFMIQLHSLRLELKTLF